MVNNFYRNTCTNYAKYSLGGSVLHNLGDRINAWDLVGFIVNLLAQHHMLSFSNSTLILICSVSGVLACTIRQVSSADSVGSLLRVLDKLLIYIRKILIQWHKLFSITKIRANQIVSVSANAIIFLIYLEVSWHTVSKAFRRSTSTKCCILLYAAVTTSNIAWVVEILF